MKATTLSYVNFRKRADSFPIEPITVLLGKNGSGKTTMISAFLSVLTGNLASTDVLPMAKSKTAVELRFDNGESLGVESTGTTTKHRINGTIVTKKDAAVMREKLLGLVPDNAAEFFTEEQRILSMSPANRASFFLSLDKSPVEVHRLTLNDYEEQLLLDITKTPSIAYAELAQVEKALSAASTAANKELAETRGKLSAFVSTSSSKPVEVLTAQRDALRKEILERKSQDDLMAQYNADKAKYDKYMEELKELSDKITKGRIPPPEKGKLESNQQVLMNLHTTIATLEQTIKTLENSKASLVTILDDLSTNICPISKQIICTTDRTPVKQEIEESIAKIDKDIEESKKKLENMRRSESTTKEFCEKLRQAELSYNEWVRMDEQFKQKHANKPQEPKKPVVTGNSGRPIDELNAELDSLSEEIAKAENRVKAQAISATIPDLEKKAEAYSKLKKVFMPNGEAYNVLMSACCQMYTDMLNTLAGGFGIPIKYRFIAKDGLVVTATGTNGIEIDASLLSNGEKIVTQFLINLMINQLTGTGFVIIDNIDKLDEDNLVAFFNLLKQSKNLYENAIICGVNHTDTVKVVQGLGVKLYM